MNVPPSQRLRITSPAGMLAVVPHLLGFTPESSLVVLGVAPPAGRIRFGLRYDLPDPPDTAAAAGIAAHAAAILGRYQLSTAVVAGYGPGPLVTPVADAVRDMASRAGVELLDVLRVQDGRFWSYLCGDSRRAARRRACRSTRPGIPRALCWRMPGCLCCPDGTRWPPPSPR